MLLIKETVRHRIPMTARQLWRKSHNKLPWPAPGVMIAPRLLAPLRMTMAYTHHELKHKTLAELRDIAKDIEHDAIQGYTQLNKEHLVVALCKALNIDMHEHHQV